MELLPAALFTDRDDIQKSARAWADAVLKDAYAPPDRCNFVLVAHSRSVPCDFARLAYVAGRLQITVTQVRFLMSIHVTIGRDGGSPSIAEIITMARLVFKGADDLKLIDAERPTGTLPHGHVDPSYRPGEKAPWLNALMWRADGQGVTFWFPKDPGDPTMGEISGSLDDNRYWFTKPPARDKGG